MFSCLEVRRTGDESARGDERMESGHTRMRRPRQEVHATDAL
jgi:hypothetical protein